VEGQIRDMLAVSRIRMFLSTATALPGILRSTSVSLCAMWCVGNERLKRLFGRKGEKI
jgi:hypothetical protein